MGAKWILMKMAADGIMMIMEAKDKDGNKISIDELERI